MQIQVTGQQFSDAVTEPEIDEALALLTGEGGEAFAILSETEMTYMQASGWPEVGFDLEYQEGSLESHFRCTREPLTLQDVARAFKQYLRGDPSYKQELPWEQDEEVASMAAPKRQGASIQWVLILAVVALIILALWYLL